MTPQDQEFLKTDNFPGDCQRAVIASLLDLPISEVPHFLAESDRTAVGFYSLIDDFLEAHGYEMAWHATPTYHLRKGQDIYHQISGPSPRGNGTWHAVVGLNGEIVHDPHPSKAGLAGDSSEWRHSFLVRHLS